MTTKDNRFRIEAAFGVPTQRSWCYNAVNTSDNLPFLEGYVAKQLDGIYLICVREHRGFGGVVGSREDSNSANELVLSSLETKAKEFLEKTAGATK